MDTPAVCATTMTPTRRLAAAGAALLLATAITACNGGSAGSAGETATATTATADPFSKGGALVDVGGRSLYLHCQGTTGPIVLLEAGLTGDARTWDHVVADLDP